MIDMSRISTAWSTFGRAISDAGAHSILVGWWNRLLVVATMTGFQDGLNR
jgi:hypothetical protein